MFTDQTFSRTETRMEAVNDAFITKVGGVCSSLASQKGAVHTYD
ncbi:MAG: hypothetical protein PHO52_07320 [Sulfuricurvum sp.]|nr:hypothetical protein [Sulfuricurvum sp.]